MDLLMYGFVVLIEVWNRIEGFIAVSALIWPQIQVSVPVVDSVDLLVGCEVTLAVSALEHSSAIYYQLSVAVGYCLFTGLTDNSR